MKIMLDFNTKSFIITLIAQDNVDALRFSFNFYISKKRKRYGGEKRNRYYFIFFY